MIADQLTHMLRHVATQGGDLTPFRYGHVASYDPTQNRVRCVIPSMTDQDGTALLSPWMPLGTPFAGSGYGIQVILKGGASATNPTDGEQVLIAIFDRQRGVAAVPCGFFHGTNKPPATDLPSTDDGYTTPADAAVAGDIIISAPPAQTGGANSFVRLRKSGQIQIWSAGAMTADVIGGLTATVNTGDVSITAKQGDVTVRSVSGNINVLGSAVRLGADAAGNLMALCKETFRTIFNLHTHDSGSPPIPQADPTTMTTIVVAE